MAHDQDHAIDSAADHLAATDITDCDADTGKHGLMPKVDKVKLNTIVANADITGSNTPQAHALGHIDGTDQIDDAFSGAAAKTVTAQGTAQVDTDVVDPWGTYTGTCLLDGNSDYLQVTDHVAFSLPGNSTIQVRFRLTSLPANGTQAIFYSQWIDADNFIWFYIHNASGVYKYSFHIYDNTGGQGEVIFLEADVVFAVDTWYVATMVHNGNTWDIYLDGVSQDQETSSDTVPNLAADVTLGMNRGTRFLHGHISDIHVSNIARETGNFTPSAAPAVPDANSVLLLPCTGADESTTFTDAAGTAYAGLMTSADKTKLDGIIALADVTGNNTPQAHQASHISGGDQLPVAITGTKGLAPSGTGATAHFLRADLTWAAPAGPASYDSGWFAVSTNTAYTKAHGLGAIPDIVQVWFSDSSDGSGEVVNWSNGGGYYSGYTSNIADLDATNIVFRTGQSRLLAYEDGAGNNTLPTSGYCKIRAFKF